MQAVPQKSEVLHGTHTLPSKRSPGRQPQVWSDLQCCPPQSASSRHSTQVKPAFILTQWGVDWPQGVSYAEFVRRLNPAIAAHAAVMHEATGVGRGATYTPFDGAPPAETEHFAVAAPYAHATAPLRRLQDRCVSECCLAAYAGVAPPEWVRAGLADLPAAMSAGTRRANAVERGVVDLVEAVLLAGREGERFDAVVIDEGLLQLRDPAVRGRLTGPSPALGSEVSVRLDRADPVARTVAFSVWSAG